MLAATGTRGVDGVLADLGVSSMQLDDAGARIQLSARPGRWTCGWTRRRGTTLAERLADVDEAALADVIWRFGEERHSRRVARAILAARDRGDLTDTAALAAVVRRAVGGRGWQRIDPGDAHVSGAADLGERRARRPRAVRRRRARRAGAGRPAGGHRVSLARGSRREAHDSGAWRTSDPAARLLTQAADRAGEDECARNPRARSARLRVLEKVA